MTSRAQLRQLATDPAANAPVYVSVDATGRVTDVSTDNKRSVPPSPRVASALENFAFVPALNKGVPAAGRAKLVVAEFVR